MFKRLTTLLLLSLTLMFNILPAHAADKRIRAEDSRVMIAMKNDIIVDPCTVEVAFNVKNNNKAVPSWDYLENVVLHFPDGDVRVGHVDGKKTIIGTTKVRITREMISRGSFTVTYSLDHHDYATDRKVRTETGRVTLSFRTAPDSFSKTVQEVKDDFTGGVWKIILIVLILLAVLGAASGGGFLIIFG